MKRVEELVFWVAAALLSVECVTCWWWLHCSPTPPPGWEHFPAWLQRWLEMRCGA